jgi:hypothetical protein
VEITIKWELQEEEAVSKAARHSLKLTNRHISPLIEKPMRYS